VEYIIERRKKIFFDDDYCLVSFLLFCLLVWCWKNFAYFSTVFFTFLVGHNLSIFETFFSLHFNLLIRPFKVVYENKHYRREREREKITETFHTKTKRKSQLKCWRQQAWNTMSIYDKFLAHLIFELLHSSWSPPQTTIIDRSTYQRSCGNTAKGVRSRQ
jgi:hypothetical protein